MRVLILIGAGLAIGFALYWIAADVVTATHGRRVEPKNEATAPAGLDLPRALQPGFGFAFLTPRPR